MSQVVTKNGVCNLCEAMCGLLLTVEKGPGGDRVTGVRGNPDDPLSRGHLCPKGVALPDLHDDPDRLRRPVRRTADGWREIPWDEALDLVADNLAAAVREHGRDALAVYLGNPNVHSLGAMTHGTAMVKSLRTRNKFSATSVDQLPHQLLAYLMFGHQLLLPIPDIDRTDLFLVLGANPMASNGSLMTVPDFPHRVRELKARGGRMVVLDPRRTETARPPTSTTSSGPAPTRWCCWRCCAPSCPRGSPLPRRTSTGWTPSPRPSSRSPPSAPRPPAGSPPPTCSGSRASSPPPAARRSTAGWACPPRSSGWSRSGRCSCSTW